MFHYFLKSTVVYKLINQAIWPRLRVKGLALTIHHWILVLCWNSNSGREGWSRDSAGIPLPSPWIIIFQKTVVFFIVIFIFSGCPKPDECTKKGKFNKIRPNSLYFEKKPTRSQILLTILTRYIQTTSCSRHCNDLIKKLNVSDCIVCHNRTSFSFNYLLQITVMFKCQVFPGWVFSTEFLRHSYLLNKHYSHCHSKWKKIQNSAEIGCQNAKLPTLLKQHFLSVD